MKGRPELTGVYQVADDILGKLMLYGGRGVSLDPDIRLRLFEMIAQALKEEREGCARTVEICDPDSTRWELANAIRARG